MIPSRANVTTVLLMAGILWAPLPAGSVTPATQLGIRLIGLAAVVAAAVVSARRSLRQVLGPLAALLALAALGLVQAAPWPAGIVRRVSPEHFRLAAEAVAAAEGELATGRIDPEPGRLGEGERVSLSLAPGRSRSAAVSLVVAAGVLFAAFVAGRRRQSRRWLAVALVAAGCLQLVLGARDFVSGVEARLRGTFVNPNHLAVLLEVSLAVCFAWMLWALRRRRGSVETRLARVGAPVLGWLFLFVGLAFTGSRAGMAAALAAALTQAVLASRTAQTRSRRPSGPIRFAGFPRLAIVAVVLSGLALVGWVGVQAGFGRLLATSRFDLASAGRFRVWEASLELVRRFPWSGSGLGSFRETFPLVQPADLELTWTRTHNDFLELLVTTGVLGLAIGLAGLVALARGLWGALGRGGRTEDRLAALAGWGVLTSVAVHATLDFGATLPANTFAVAVALGAALSARLTLSSREAQRDPGPSALPRS